MSETVLQVKDLRTHFFTRSGVVKAVDGVTFSVGERETLGIVGESGSGKSMTALSILRLVPSPAGKIVGGRVLLRGDDLLAKSEREMRKIRGSRISMILQDPMTSLDPLFTIGDQLAEPIRIHQREGTTSVPARVEEMLRLVKIPAPDSRMNDYPHQMSGGMRQRIVGAIALACQPELLIADEPTTSLDVTIQAQFLALLKEVQRELGLAMIVITHDFGIVARLCHRVAVMYAGRIVEEADVRTLFRHPAHPYTAALLRSLPQLGRESDRLCSIGGQPPDLRCLPPGCSFAPRCSKAIDVCRSEYPAQRDLGDGHHVCCHVAATECWTTG
ncbi:MAG TPA: ABC transporter ATP-binding protein [Candidatus Methylomirabilis sp.]|nr:ABC transporter ATP-binding protein [Candidatus Methylomirabilis sp.]